VRSRAADERAGESFRAALADRRLVMFLLATVSITWAVSQMTSTLPMAQRTAAARPISARASGRRR
jgi:hypothetical protein